MTVLCPSCVQTTLPTDEGTCAWCGTRLVSRGPKPRDRRQRQHSNAGHPIMMTSDQVEEAWLLYEQGLSLRAVAREILPATGYASLMACANQLHEQWTLRGYKLRDRITATVQATLRNGKSRRGRKDREHRAMLRRRSGEIRGATCKATKTQAPGKGKPCSRSALAGSDYCIAHDPERAEWRSANLRAARAKLGMAA